MDTTNKHIETALYNMGVDDEGVALVSAVLVSLKSDNDFSHRKTTGCWEITMHDSVLSANIISAIQSQFAKEGDQRLLRVEINVTTSTIAVAEKMRIMTHRELVCVWYNSHFTSHLNN